MSDDFKALQEFCSYSHPGTIADFPGTLSPGEAWNILTLPEPRVRAEIFGHLSPQSPDLSQISYRENLSKL
jgi:hypothetical protein